MSAMKASVAQANRQLSRKKSPCFVLLYPFHSIIVVSLRASFTRMQTSIVRATLCPFVQQGANHFCRPSDLLSTTTCFSKLIAYIFWCSSCGKKLIQFATHCCPTATLTVRRARSQSPKNAHEHYHGLLEHCIHKFTRQYCPLGLLHGGFASLGHIFKGHLSPDHPS
jgi:hypothetical protein